MSRIQVAIRITSKAPVGVPNPQHEWHMFVQEADVWEHRLSRIAKAYFRRVRGEVLKRLLEIGPSVEGQYRGWSRRKVVQHISRKSPIDRINIDKAAERRALVQLFDPMIQVMVERRGGEFLAGTIGSAIGFNVNDPAVQYYIGDRMEKFSRQVAGTTFDDIKATLRTGFTEGQPIMAIAETLRQTFDSYDKYRAPLIARTETISALNKTDLLALEQAGVMDRFTKAWLTAGDENVRESHVLAGRFYQANPIPVNYLFNVGGDSMEAPGLGDDPAENINCRCTVSYRKKAAPVAPPPPPRPPRPRARRKPALARPAPPKPAPEPIKAEVRPYVGDEAFNLTYGMKLRRPQPVPSTVRSNYQLVDYMQSQMKGVAVTIDDGVSTKAMKRSVDELFELSNKYPEVNMNMKYLGTAESEDGMIRIGQAGWARYWKENSNAYAAADFQSMAWNPKWYKSESALNRQIMSDSSSGWHPRSAANGTIESITDHEFGHNMSLMWEFPREATTYSPRSYGAIWANAKDPAVKKARKIMQERVLRLRKVWDEWVDFIHMVDPEELGTMVSRYAMTNEREAFAESWSDGYIKKKLGRELNAFNEKALELSEKAQRILRGME